MSDDIIERINARCAESAAFARGAAEMQRRAIAACEACASDVTETVSDPDEAAELAVAACVAAVRVTPWPTMTVNDAPSLAQWLRDRADAVVNDDPAAASTLYLAAEQAPAGIVAPSWGPLPTAAEVEAHVAHCAPARPHSGAPWARKHGDSSGDGVSIVYLRADAERLWWRTPTGGIWYVFNDRDARGQWRPVDGDGMPVERGER